MSEEDPTFYERKEVLEIGVILKEVRSRRGLTLDDVEQATKIRRRYLEGLENDDYSVLPDAVYARGFLKTYANYLDLDGEELAGKLRSRRPRQEWHGNQGDFRKTGFDEPLINPGGLAGAERRGIPIATVLTLFVSMIVIMGIIGTLYYVGNESQSSKKNQAPPAKKSDVKADAKSADAKSSSGNSNGASEKGDKSAAGSEAKPKDPGDGKTQDAAANKDVPPQTLGVSVNVEGSESWISVQSDGVLVYEQIAQPGFSETFEAKKELTISTGNAGAVTVSVNGQNIGVMGTYGEVVLNRSFTLKSAS